MVTSASESPRYPVQRFCWMMANAARLKCPTCGRRPIFIPWHQVRGLRDWFMPLDGCPDCGYPFEREPGYFLLSIFAINYGAGALMRFSPLFDFCFLDQISHRATSGLGHPPNTVFQFLVRPPFESLFYRL